MLSGPQNISAKKVFSSYNDKDLSFDKFLELSQNNCWYCDCPPSNVYNWYVSCIKSKPYTSQYLIDNGTFIYNGLDRLDNTKLHDTSNVVPCCFICNRAKNNMNFYDFRSHIISMSKFRELNYNRDYNKIIVPSFDLSANNVSIVIPNAVVLGSVFGKLTVIAEADKKPMGQGKHKRNFKAFLCKCSCGTEKVIIARSLLLGHSKSCNNGLCRGNNTPQISSAKKLWSSGGYKKEGLPFEAFYQCSQMNCFYCGISPSNSYASDRSPLKEHRFIYNGLDRLNPLDNHNINNIIPCCWICNRMKNNLSIQKFDDWLTRIYNNFILINGTRYA